MMLKDVNEQKCTDCFNSARSGLIMIHLPMTLQDSTSTFKRLKKLLHGFFVFSMFFPYFLRLVKQISLRSSSS